MPSYRDSLDVKALEKLCKNNNTYNKNNLKKSKDTLNILKY